MNNTEVFYSTEFGTFLLESKIITAGKEKYLVHWGRKFFECREQLPGHLNWVEQLPLFLRELNVSGNCQDWQVRQADQAVLLYFGNFLAAFPEMKCSDAEPEPQSVPRGQDAVLQRFREDLRLRNYSRMTEKTYLGWVRQYLRFCSERTSSENSVAISPEHVRDFLAFLAMQRNVSASTQNQAFNSLLTFFRLVFNTELDDLRHAVRARTGKRLPVVFSVEEIREIQELLGYAKVETTMIYTHVVKDMRNPVASPLDVLG